MNKAFKFRAYPNSQQQVLFAKTFGCVRFVYNLMLSDKIKHYEETGQRLNNTPAQYKKQFEWLREVDSLALSNAQLHLQAAYNNFFNNSKSGFPKFKSKHKTKKSYTTNCINNNIVIADGYLKLPKVGMLKIKQHRRISDDYRLKSVTVSQSASGKYYVSMLFEYDADISPVKPVSFLGLDFSMHELYADSNGNCACYPRFYRQFEKRLAREQRKLSHMQKSSRNRSKQKFKVARLHEKIANQRRDFLHKQSRMIAKSYDCVCIEDLNMQAMSKTLNFGKSVHDNAWGTFIRFLKYKLEDEGKQLVKIDKWFPSSQICSNCGEQNSVTKDLSVRQWTCPVCRHTHDRDYNAAINIRNEGIGLVTV